MMYLPKESSGLSASDDEQEDLFRQKVQVLWQEQCFVDVTLACEDKLLTAHKLVLSAYSDYFKDMFSSIQKSNQYPIVFMRDVSHDIVKAILEFMYCGEVNVAQYNLNAFMKTARSLRIKGLSIAEDIGESEEDQPTKRKHPSGLETRSSPVKKRKCQIQYPSADYEEPPPKFSPRNRRPTSARKPDLKPQQPLKKNSFEGGMRPNLKTGIVHSASKSKPGYLKRKEVPSMDSSDSDEMGFNDELPTKMSYTKETPKVNYNSDVTSKIPKSEEKSKEVELSKSLPKMGNQPSDELIHMALQALEKGMTVSKASKHFHIPVKTLSSKWLNYKAANDELNQDRSSSPNSFGTMDAELENKLLKIIDYTSQITPLTCNQVKLFAWAIESVLGNNSFSSDGPNKNWWNRFKRKNPRINKVLRSYDFLKASLLKPKDFSFSALTDYLTPIQEIIEAFDLSEKPQSFWSCSEYTLDLNEPSKGFFPSRERFITNSKCPKNGDFMSIMFAGSADGKKISPFAVFKDSGPSEEFTKQGPTTAMYDHSKTGFLDSDLMQKWFEHIFLPQCPQNRSEDNPVILLLNSNFPLASSAMLDLAFSENVILLSLMPHLHHVVQPMDIPVALGLRKSFKGISGLEDIRGKTTKDHVPKLIKEPFEKNMTSEIISKGFRVCGIFPLSSNINQSEYMEIRTQLKLDQYPSSLSCEKSEVDIEQMLRTQSRKIKILQNKNESGTSDEEEVLEDSNACYVCGKEVPKEGTGQWVMCTKRYCKNSSCDECLPINYDKTNEYICIDCNH